MKNDNFFTERDKTLGKVFFLIFLFFVLLINWNNISNLLSLKVAPELLKQYVYNITSPEEISIFEYVIEEDFDSCSGGDGIVIPKIEVEAPIVIAHGTSEKEYREALDKGVVLYPDGNTPENEGLTVLLGHSAPPGWPDVRYDGIFSEINELRGGDTIDICYNEKLYQYSVIEETESERFYNVGDEVPPLYPDNKKRELVLMTCWPPGDSSGRMGVRAVIE